MSGMTLTEFLLARIAEDLDLVGAEPYGREEGGMRIEWADVGGIGDCLLIGEARLRAECEAKRRIVAQDMATVNRLLALPYADHDDYRQEWKP